ncbi:hypothetical protein BDN72DRAFT_735468, partial [Pluteus cervinus]
MTNQVSEDLKNRIVHWYIEEGRTYRQIRDLSGCSLGLISKTLRNHYAFGVVNNPFSRRSGRPSMVTDDDIRYIISILKANPVLYLDEIQTRLAAVR